MKRIVFFAMMLIGLLGAAKADLESSEKLAKFGNWTVLRETDKMTDKQSCSAVLGIDYGIRLIDNALFVYVPRRFESYRLRFDKNPARSLRRIGDLEKKFNSVIIAGENFTEALNATNLIIQLNPLGPDSHIIEFETVGIDQAVQFMKTDCHAPAKVGVSPSIGLATTIEACSPLQMERMREAGVTPAQISKVCN